MKYHATLPYAASAKSTERLVSNTAGHLQVSKKTFVGGWFTSWQHLRSYQDLWQCTVIAMLYIIRAASQEDQAYKTHHDLMTYPTESHYHDTELTSPGHILLMLSARLGSDKYQFCKSLVRLDQESNSQPSAREAIALPIRPPCRRLLYPYADLLTITKKNRT